MESRSPIPKTSYPFLKHFSHFRTETKDASIPDESEHHKIVERQKEYDKNKSEERNSSKWIQIFNKTVKPECEARLNRLIVLTGELFRLLDINNTKYRIITDGEQEHPLSKKIEGGIEFFEYMSDKLKSPIKKHKYVSEKNFGFLLRDKQAAEYIRVRMGDGNIWWVRYLDHDFNEGAGRGILGNLFYINWDGHFGNIFIDDSYFKVIDHDRAFAPVSLDFHDDYYFIKKKPDKMIELQQEEKNENGKINLKIQVPKTKKKIKAVLSLNDWNTLPILHDHKPSRWQWNDDAVKPYARKLSMDPEFLAEKFFGSFKLMATYEIQSWLINYHIENKEDKAELQQLLSQQCRDLFNICDQSHAFRTFAQSNRVEMICAILFECDQFLKMNRHYKSSREGDALLEWKSIMNFTLQKAIETFQQLKIDLTDKDIEFLKQFTNDIHMQKTKALDVVEDFYLKHKMTTYVKIVERVKPHAPSPSLKRKVKTLFVCDEPKKSESQEISGPLDRVATDFYVKKEGELCSAKYK